MFTLTKVPPNAVLGGTTAEGSKLYICKARDQDPDQWKIGHYDPANSKYCFVHHGVDEAKFADFFVLAISETSAYRFFFPFFETFFYFLKIPYSRNLLVRE